MGGKKGNEALGKALIRRRKADQKSHRNAKAQVNPLQSVMEFTDLQVVLEQAEEAGRIFSDEHPPPELVNLQEKTNRADQRKEEMLYESNLTVPRRPAWHQKMSVEQLDAQERQAFLNWRRGLARLEENEKLVLTPFEKNIEVWRQLWRVIERCDLVVMVVDARNPLFYRCPDLEAYVKELDENKRMMLLLNKSDLLPTSVRKKWAKYFRSQGLDYVFWSAKHATEVLKGKSQKQVDIDEDVRVLDREELLTHLQAEAEKINSTRNSSTGDHQASTSLDASSSSEKLSEKRVAVGFVGYPNVGKSSTINVLVGQKRTGVTSTPGKTKHFQTLIINERLMLCDCPGLVFPSFTSSKAEMVVAGVLPVDKMTDYRGPIQVIANQMPRRGIEEAYGLKLPKPRAYEDQNRAPRAAEVLRSYAQKRGYVISSGLPDETRSARQILKDYLSGKLLFCHSPPDDDDEDEEVEDEDEEVDDEDEDEDGDEDEDDTEDGDEDEDEVEDEDDEGEDEEIEDEKLGSGLSLEVEKDHLDEVFRDVDLKAQEVKPVKVKRAAHKMQKKAQRKKDRSWRVKDDESEGMARVRGVARAVSHGAAPR